MIPFQSQEEGCTTSEHLSAGPEADVENLELHLHVIAGIQGLAQRMDRVEACQSGQHCMPPPRPHRNAEKVDPQRR